MTYEERRTTLVHDREPAPAPYAQRTAYESVDEHRVGTVRPTGSTLAARIIVVVFGVIQALIAIRFVLLALDAREGNALVSLILGLSQVFVAPFEGILRTDAIGAGGSVIDVAAILAIVGWTLLELLLLALVRIARPGDDV